MSKAGDYYRLWLRCRKQELYGPQEEAHLAHQKVGEHRDVQMQEAGDGPSHLEKNPHSHTETKIKRNFSQPPLPLNAKNCSYTDFTGKDRKERKSPLGASEWLFLARRQCCQRHMCSSPSPPRLSFLPSLLSLPPNSPIPSSGHKQVRPPSVPVDMSPSF